MLLAFHKPYGVLSQFTPEPGSRWRTLADFAFPKGVYPLGRLDAESEGLLLLSDEGELNARLLEPRQGHRRTYWAQVERIPSTEALVRLAGGVMAGGRMTQPCRTWLLEPQPDLPPRDPPIRSRKNVPDCWVGLELIEGKYHQVRKMTAAVGHPTLRLIRTAIGDFQPANLEPRKWRPLDAAERALIFA
ncbi:MAG TPA: pseudouridine synthase [Chthoniobacteraceae bacterium]|jgi:23S rRNA pseudouridine2457 synthase